MSVVGVTARERPVGLSNWARTLLNAPDVTMLPSQQRRDQKTPELELVFAVLEQSIADLEKWNNATTWQSRGQAREIAAWFCTDDIDWLYSFRNCCDLLGMEPEYIRRGLKTQLGRAMR